MDIHKGYMGILKVSEEELKNNPKASEDEFYGNWIKCYSGKDYCDLNKILVKALEEAVKNYSEEELDHICEIFRECSLYEMKFWDMANR